MFIQLRGVVAHKDPAYIVLDVAGVGYKVYVTPHTLAHTPENEEATLWTHLAVREQSLDVYGFLTQSDLEFFELLIGVSGVGPKSALGILSIADANTLRAAITQGDTTYLTKVSGIGAKSAKKIVLELGDKLGSRVEGNLAHDADAIDALTTMGYSLPEAREALKAVPADVTGASERLKSALKNLAT